MLKQLFSCPERCRVAADAGRKVSKGQGVKGLGF